MLEIKDDFYKYVYKVDLAQLDLARRNEYMLGESTNYLEMTTSKILLYLRMCDFTSLKNTLQSFSENLMKENSVSSLFPGVNRELSLIFDYLYQYICTLDNFIIKHIDGMNVKEEIIRNTYALE